MRIGIIGAGKIGCVLGDLSSKFASVVYLDKKPGYSNDYKLLEECDLSFICVNTTTDTQYDMSNVDECLALAKQNNVKNIVIISTCIPSYFKTETFSRNKLNVFYNPLFVRQGTISDDIRNAEFVLIGCQDSPHPLLIDFYKRIRLDFKFITTGFQEAAVIKMGINGFLCLKIAYANMIGDYAIKEKLNPDIILDAMSQCKTINPHYFKYGFGFGGPCLPIDNFTLASEIENQFPLRVDEENSKHIEFMIEQYKNNIRQPTVIEGVGYKKNVPIITHSQKLLLAVSLAKDGYNVVIKDTKEVCDLVEEKYPRLFSFQEI